MTRARTYIKLNESRVGKIKSQIEPIIPDDWMREENPHISILPSFKIPTEYEDEIQKRIQTTLRQFSLYRVKIKGYHIYPPLDSNQQTYVVSLDPDINISHIRQRQKDILEKYEGAKILHNPVKPHITLYKSGDEPDPNKNDLDMSQKEFDMKLINMNIDFSFSIPIQSKEFEKY